MKEPFDFEEVDGLEPDEEPEALEEARDIVAAMLAAESD